MVPTEHTSYSRNDTNVRYLNPDYSNTKKRILFFKLGLNSNAYRFHFIESFKSVSEKEATIGWHLLDYWHASRPIETAENLTEATI